MSRRPASPLVLAVGDMLRHPGSTREIDADLDLGPLSVLETLVAEGAQTEVRLRLEALDSALTLRGTIQVPWVGVCRRCLGPVAGRSRIDVLEIFETEPVDGETWPIDHEQVDVGALVREVVLLELPVAPLCRDDCAGLCPTCGADRNLGPCPCPDGTVDPRWSSLEGLRFEVGPDDSPG